MEMNSMKRIWNNMVVSSKFFLSTCTVLSSLAIIHNEFTSEDNCFNIPCKYSPNTPPKPSKKSE